MTRDVSSTIISGSSIYSYTEVTNWEVGPTACTYKHVGGVTSGFGWNISATSQLQWWESGTWHDYATAGTGTFTGYGDMELCSTVDSFGRGATDRTVSLGCLTTVSGNSARAWIDYTVPHLPDAPTSLTATRVTDNKVTLSWSEPSRIYEATCIERSVDGGSYSEIAVLWNTATSWDDTTTAADHSYKYRIRAYYAYAYSDYTAETASIAMTPTAPTSMTTAATTGTTVTVSLVNASPVATGLKVELSANGSTWTAQPTQSGSPVTSFSVDMTTNKYIRVCNTNATGDSAWLTSGEIITVTKPNKPTVTANMNGGTWDISKSLTLTIGYSSADGSAQQYYKYSYQIKPAGGSWGNTTSSANIAKAADSGTSWTLDMGDADDFSLSVGDSIRFEVSVKGASATWSDYSAWCELTVKQKPTINITSPASSITAMPISIAATYTDNSGTCAAASYYLVGNSQRYPQSGTLPMEVNGSALSASITASDFLPANGASYTIYVTARSSSSLQYTANATFQTAFTEPTAGDLSIQNDPDTGYVSLLATYDNTDADEPAVSISVARVNADGTTTPLLTDGASGSGVVDKYAPLNTPYQYAVTTTSAAHAIKTVYVDNEIVTDLWFAYWGDNIASAKWNPDNGGIQLQRPQKVRVFYAGRKDPVSYDGSAVSLTETPSWMLVDRSEVQPFVQLIEDGGRGVYKSCDGWVYHADFDLTLTPKYIAIGYYGGVGLSVTRIAGEQL